MGDSSIKTKILNGLRSNWSLFIGVAVGLYIALWAKQYVDYIAPVGLIYVDVLKMCIFPILVSAISVSISRLMQARENTNYIGRMAVVFLISIIVSGILGVAMGEIGKPGKGYDIKTLSTLGSIINKAGTTDLEVSLSEPFVAPPKTSFVNSFFSNLVPENIFAALSSGSSLKVLFFAILFGLAIGCLKKETSQTLVSSLDSMYLAFAKVVQWLMYFLPFGLCGLIAHDVSKVGIDVLVAMMKFVPIALASFAVLFVISSLVMWQRTGSLIKPLQALKDTIVMAIGTGNALACLPSALTAMSEKLGYEKRTVDLLVPLTFTVCRTGPTLYFALATIFVAQLYNVELGVDSLTMVIIGSVFAGLATAGASGVVLLSMLSLVLAPLGLPVEAVMVLFIIIDPIIGPFRVVAIVHTSCAVVTLILPKQSLADDTHSEKVLEAIRASP